MIHYIPPQSTRRWTGIYQGNYYGTLWKTFNVDLDREEGKIALSRRMTQVADTTDTNSDTLLLVTAFLRADADCTDRWWALSLANQSDSDVGQLYLTAGTTPVNPSDSWQVETRDSAPTRAKDMTVFERDTRGDSLNRSQLFVTTDTDIAVLNDTGTPVWKGNWWTGATEQAHSGDSALDSGVPHPIEYFPFRRIGLVGSRNRIHTISRTSDTVNETTAVNRLVLPKELQIRHIFTTNIRVWIICSNRFGGNGKVVEWDGFSQIYNDIHDIYARTALSGIGYEEIPIVINNKGAILEFTGKGFKPMIRNGQVIALPVFEEQDNALGITNNALIDGIAPRGMTKGEDGLIYINVRNPNSNSFRNGGGIWCLNPITGRLYLKYATGAWTNTTFGEQRNLPGAIHAVPSGSGLVPNLLVGGWYNNNSVNFDASAIWALADYSSTTATRGYFITQFIPANEITEAWQNLWIHFKRFATAANRIVVKAKGVRSLRSSLAFALEASITWVNATSFTVTLAAADDALEVGDEVEVINGVNSGTLSHITAITGDHAALQTITIDETLTASTNEARARFDRWKKLGTISNASKYEDVVNTGITSSFIQYKVEMRGPASEMQISDLVSVSEPSVFKKK